MNTLGESEHIRLKKKKEIKLLINPSIGLSCIGIGLVIINSGLNVHSGEIFLWLLSVFGFLLVLPITFFARSIDSLRKDEVNEKTKTRIFSIVLTILLGVIWTSLLIVAFVKEW